MKKRVVVIMAVVFVLGVQLSAASIKKVNEDIPTVGQLQAITNDFVTPEDLESGRADKHGIGLTVFKGVEVERFWVEYDSVEDHLIFPKERMINVRMGKPLLGSNVLAGMSGSMVYFKKNGKWCMAGAIAFGYNMPTVGKSLGGITPIGAMLTQRKISDFVGSAAINQRQEQFRSKLEEYGQYQKNHQGQDQETFRLERELLKILSQPIELGKYRKGTLQLLQPAFTVVRHNSKLNSSGNSQVVTPKPGDAVMMMFVEGDISWGGTCTVTYVADGKYLACGHPIFGDGPLLMPAYRAIIATPYKSPWYAWKEVTDYSDSFGYIDFDSIFAVEGKVKPVPKDAMIPVKLKVSFGGRKPIEVNYKVFRDKLYTAWLIGAGNYLLSNFWNNKRKATTRAVSTIKVDNRIIKFYDAYTSGAEDNLWDIIFSDGPWLAIYKTASFVGRIMYSRWDLKVQEVNVNLDIELGEKVFKVDTCRAVDKKGKVIEEVGPGSKFWLVLGLRGSDGKGNFVIKIPVEIPKKLKIIRRDLLGKLLNQVPMDVYIESGNNYHERDESKFLDHPPDNKDEFLESLLLNKQDPQKLYIQVVFPKTEIEEDKKEEPFVVPDNSENNWIEVKNFKALRSLKLSQRLVLVKEYDSPLKDFILDVEQRIPLMLKFK